MTDVIKKLITPKNSPINEAIPYIYVEKLFYSYFCTNV